MTRALSVAPDHPAFAGHFPGRAVLPAVVVLTEVLATIEAQSGRSLELWTIATAKFLAAITPGESLTLSHTATPSGAIRFEVRSVRGVVASGTLTPRHGS
jgi:3-hydroxyacyl-[acyl-carrier-protein] dehydratase